MEGAPARPWERAGEKVNADVSRETAGSGTTMAPVGQTPDELLIRFLLRCASTGGYASRTTRNGELAPPSPALRPPRRCERA